MLSISIMLITLLRWSTRCKQIMSILQHLLNILSITIESILDQYFTKNICQGKILKILTHFEYSRAILELNKSQGLHDLGEIKYDMALCLLIVYLICYFSLWKGIKTSGKVVWFTAIFPYFVLLMLFIRGITLPGSAEGIAYYLRPDFSVLKQSEVSHRN